MMSKPPQLRFPNNPPIYNMQFRQWVENSNTTCVSFDYDGVLHTDVHHGTIDPIDYYNNRPTPNAELIYRLKQEAKLHRIIIVTARCDTEEVESFIQWQRLPVSQIFVTCGRPKIDVLKANKAIRHYDDNPKMSSELRGSGIEFILVDPRLQESSIRQQCKLGLYPDISDAMGQHPPLYGMPAAADYITYLWIKYGEKGPPSKDGIVFVPPQRIINDRKLPPA